MGRGKFIMERHLHTGIINSTATDLSGGGAFYCDTGELVHTLALWSNYATTCIGKLRSCYKYNKCIKSFLGYS